MNHERFTIDCDEAIPAFTAAYLRVAGDECAFIETYTSHAEIACSPRSRKPGKRRRACDGSSSRMRISIMPPGASAMVKACPNACSSRIHALPAT